MLASARRCGLPYLPEGWDFTPQTELELEFCVHLFPGAPVRNVAMPLAQGITLKWHVQTPRPVC